MKARKLSDLFMSYPYKKRHEKNITRPSLAGQEFRENHKLSMTWRQWHEFVKIMLKYTKLYLLSGSQVVLPYKAGVLQLHKKRGKPSVDWHRFNTTGEYTHHLNNHTNGYSITFRWYRNKGVANIKNRFLWAAVLVRTFRNEIAANIKSDPLLIETYSTPANVRKASEKITI